ncbi:WD40 repeat containing protein [Deinococcus aerius]|uniref:WD40 repeat containing protein n=1 Tax=Deinococcus aerius TaxID=200253 RepID=A0A2I9CY86_9DEIO|nr:PD40 domain-containing protein [Deinococcus aerius]GBF07102.1 WD40 repeat containing protein [Deinococcus aerius]
MKRGAALALALGASALAATLPSRAVLSGTCCPGAVWTPDSRALLFLDGPPARASTGIYQIPANGGPVTRRFSSVAFFSPLLRWAVRPGTGETTTLERLADGRKFTLPTYGSDVTWNAAETRLAYTRSATTGNFDRRSTRVFVADVFGSPRQVATLYGGGVGGWLNDSTLLLTGKRNPGDRDRDLYTLNTRTGARRTLATALSFRGLSVSPDGARVVYYVAFDSAARNGLWLRPTAGGAARRLDAFGSYRWRDANRLLLIPLTPGGGPHVLREYDVRTNTWRTLGDLGDQVRQGDWSVSPDGRKVAYLSARDGNVRVVELPENGD